MNLIKKVQEFKILFGLPTYDSKVDIHYMMSMISTSHMLNKYGIKHDIAPVLRDVYVARARNEIVNEFLKREDYTHLFFIDADMGWDPKKVLKLIARDKDVIFGAYLLKTDDKYQYSHQPLKSGSKLISNNGLIQCLSGPTGFMCIKKDVFIKMREKYPDYAYENGYAYFHCSVRALNDTPRQWYGEDVDFCHKWVSMGGEIWCEPDIDFKHCGMKIWDCNYWSDIQKVQEHEKKKQEKEVKYVYNIRN